jgi:hypothetical protein
MQGGIAMSDTNPTPDSQDLKQKARYDLNRIVPPYGPSGPDPIIGGAPTRNFPDCAAVGDDDQFCCSGTLIAPGLVVTAKHCGKLTRVFLKGYDVHNLDSAELRRVAQQVNHPDVDLSLLLLDADSSALPRRIASITQVDTTRAWAVGFGYTGYNKIDYGKKNMVEVPIMSLDCTGATDPALYGCRQSVELVAGHRGLNKGTCFGDSGGPLYVSGLVGGHYLLG